MNWVHSNAGERVLDLKVVQHILGEAEVCLEEGGTSVEVPVHPVASVLRLVLGQLLGLSTIRPRR